MAKKKASSIAAARVDLGSKVVTVALPDPEPRRTHQIQIRLDDLNMGALKDLARKRQTTPTTLARQVVEAFLKAVRDQDDST